MVILILDSHQLLRQPGLTLRKMSSKPDRVHNHYDLRARRDNRCVGMIPFATSYLRFTAVQLFCIVAGYRMARNGPSREGFALSKKKKNIGISILLLNSLSSQGLSGILCPSAFILLPSILQPYFTISLSRLHNLPYRLVRGKMKPRCQL